MDKILSSWVGEKNNFICVSMINRPRTTCNTPLEIWKKTVPLNTAWVTIILAKTKHSGILGCPSYPTLNLPLPPPFLPIHKSQLSSEEMSAVLARLTPPPSPLRHFILIMDRNWEWRIRQCNYWFEIEHRKDWFEIGHKSICQKFWMITNSFS